MSQLKEYKRRPQALQSHVDIVLRAVVGTMLLVIAVVMIAAPPKHHTVRTLQTPFAKLFAASAQAVTVSISNNPQNCATTACIALTFDDGPDPHRTPRILETLAAYKVRATFFIVGVQAKAHPDIVARIYREGHEVGNHSWDHSTFTRLTPSQVRAQIEATQQAVMAADVPPPYWFRPPYGAMNAQARAHIPLAVALWNIDPEDWNKKDPAKVVEHITTHARPGGVIDMHDTTQSTVDALPAVLDALRPQYRFVTMSELFHAGPGQRGEYYGR